MIHSLVHLHSRARFFISVALAILAFLLSSPRLHPLSGLVLAWNVGALSWLILVVLMMNAITPAETRERSQSREPRTGWMVFVTTAAAVASLIAMAYMLINIPGLPEVNITLHTTLSVVAVFSSWLLTHTKFALHYARVYYDKTAATAHQPYAQGLTYTGVASPGEGLLHYWDFMYLSFTVAMTASVSDVGVTTLSMRKLVLIHAIVSFFFYTVILGLVLNGISSLL